MNGTIFFHLHRYVEKTLGESVWSQLLAHAQLPDKQFSPVATYPDQDIIALVNAAVEMTGLSANEVLESFGQFLAPELVAIYPSLVDARWRTLDLIVHAENVIHEAVRAQNPDASPPVLRAQRIDSKSVNLVYASPRMMCALLKGIVRGMADHYGERIQIEQESCMHDGAPFCSFVFHKLGDVLSQADTVTLGTATPKSSSHWVQKSDLPGETKLTDGDASFEAVPTTPGVRSIGSYQIVEKIGSGGMGEVYLAQDVVLNRWVAIKVLLADKLSYESRKRFLEEARSMASISHEHLVPVYHVGDDEGVPYIVMPRLVGTTLEDWMNEGNRPSIDHALLITFQILSALSVAHESQILHRDIKPGNIWLESPKGKAKLMDFGLSLDVAAVEASQMRLTDPDTFVCTPMYLPPELLRGENSDARSDIYSLGVVLYEMLTGVQPFSGPTVEEVFLRIATDPPESPKALVADIPTCVDQFVMRMMANRPENRPESAAAAAQEVQSIFQEMRAAEL